MRYLSYIFVSLFLVIFPLTAVFSFGKNKIVFNTHTWKRLRTTHFNIYFPEDIADLAKQAAVIAEEAASYLSEKMDHDLSSPVPLIIYPSAQDFQGTNIIPHLIGEGTGGFTELMQRRVAIPVTGSWSRLRHVITHELVHVFQFDILLGDGIDSVIGAPYLRMPLWLMEGMAEYYSLGWDESVEHFLRDAVMYEALPSLQMINNYQVPSYYSFYKFGQAIFYFIASEYGERKIIEIFKDIRDTRLNLDQLFQIHLGKNVKELNLEWRRWLQRRYWPIVGKRNFYNEGNVLLRTDHLKKWTPLNLKPSVSPDGKKIAYFTNENLYTNIAVAGFPKKGEEKKLSKKRMIVDGNITSRFEQLKVFSNRISWSADSKRIIFVAKSKAKDYIYFVNARNGRLVKKILLPFRSVSYPTFYDKLGQIVFVAVRRDHTEIYRYHITSKKLEPLVEDGFDKREPLLSPDGKILYYISNENQVNDFSNNSGRLIAYNLNTKVKKQLLGNVDKITSMDISSDGKRLLYVSSEKGVQNIYLASLESDIQEDPRQITNTLGGAHYPRFFPDTKKMVFNSYYIYGYDIAEKKLSDSGNQENADVEELPLDRFKVPSLQEVVFLRGIDNYRMRIEPEILGLSLGYSAYGLIGFIQSNFTDMMGDYRVQTTVFYNSDDKDANFQLTYVDLKERWNWFAGIYRIKNFLNVITLSNLNEIFINSNYDTKSMNRYGFFVGTMYPFNRFFRTELKFSSSRYEKEFYPIYEKEDIAGNLHDVSAALIFDNTLWGKSYPVQGNRSFLQYSSSVDLSGHDIDIQHVDLDFRQYFRLTRKYSFAFRTVYGRVFGPDAELFPYEIGGFFTIRGHPFRAYRGTEMALMNVEFRFPFVEAIRFGWPFQFTLGEIGGLWFVDMGAAWGPEEFRFQDEDGRFDTVKASYGFGLRAVLLPFIIFRLDFASPWDGKRGKPISKWQGEFSIGFDY